MSGFALRSRVYMRIYTVERTYGLTRQMQKETT